MPVAQRIAAARAQGKLGVCHQERALLGCPGWLLIRGRVRDGSADAGAEGGVG
jgi:hypothetical protein